MLRLPYLLSYYRKLGVQHFLIVDNDSDDGTTAFLAQQPDVSLWTTAASYRLSRFGMDWLGWLQIQHGAGHWCLTVDADELLVYPHVDDRPLAALAAHLDQTGQRSLGALMLDMYPKGPVSESIYAPGGDPMQVLDWFDADSYRVTNHAYYGNPWIQGGPRARIFFGDEPQRAPTLNKYPFVKWDRRYVYVNSTHQILPAKLHDDFDPISGKKISGVLLHTKFLPNIAEKSTEELARGQHFQNTELYQDYHKVLATGPTLWHPDASTKYEGSAQLDRLGLMRKGDWT